MYKVSVSGTTNLNGISQWNAGDFAFFDGATWDKIDGLASEVISVAGRTGNVVLSASDITNLGTAATQNVGAFAQTSNNLSDLSSTSTALTNLLPSQTGNSGKVLTTSGSGVSWATPSSGSTSKPGALTINVLSDSQGAQSIYQPGNLDISNVQTWLPSTAYIVNEVVKYNGYLFYSSVAATSGTTPPTPAAPSDGTITWSVMAPVSNKFGNSILSWMEFWSDGRMVWNMDDGYKGTNIGLVKVIVVNGGSGYTNPTITPINGVKATVQQSGGVITGVTIQSPGRATGYFTLTISDPTGSGAVISTVGGPSGTFGVSGCTSDDMVARLPDVLASNVDVMLVLFPTNDLTANYTFSKITGNLKTILDTLAPAKKGVVIETGTPRTLLNQAQVQVLNRCNRWIRQYCQGRRDAGFNNYGYTNVVLSDPTGYLTDATPSNTNLNWPIGGQSQSGNAVTIDGLHPNERGGCIRGYCATQSGGVFFPPAPAYPARSYSASDCYDPVQNPGGNRLEAMPWTAGTAIVVGQSRANNNNVYFCTTAGTTASSGGPSGTGTSITDGSVVWTYAFPQFMSVLGSGTAGTIANPGGSTSITISGQLFTGAYLSRATGGTNTAGTITAAIESPWSNGQMGQRQSLAFSLGGGSATESFQLRLGYLNYNQLGILASDLGVTPFTIDMEVEITGAANLTTCYPYVSGPNGATMLAGPSSNGTGNHLPSSTGEPIALPPKMLIKSPPLILPLNTTIIGLYANIGFDASGAAGSATGTIKINKFGFQQAGIA